MRTSGHRVLITGGAKGIGLALAKQFHAAGNRVVLIGRDPAALLAAEQSLAGAQTRVADVANAADRAMLAHEYGDVSVLVNNAGIQCNGEFAQMPAAGIENEMNINFLAPALLTHAFLPHLRKHSESAIVNVSSVLALVPKQSASIYCASKAALHSFTRSLRWQLEGTGVRVFELMPPLVDTAMTAGRGKGKISPEALAATFWAGFQADQFELLAGKAKAARLLARLSPSLAERVMRRG
jgi:uncharacterized oxidoreductase